MTNQVIIQFVTESVEADKRFIRDYVFDAIDRIPKQTDCEGISYVPAGQKIPNQGLVLLQIVEDVDTVIDLEKSRWDSLIERDLVDSWEMEDFEDELVKQWGNKGAKLHTRIDILAAKLSKTVIKAFDQPPDPIDAYPTESDDRESRFGVGWWRLLHLLTLQQGLDYNDEIDCYAVGLQHAIRKLAEYEGAKSANQRLDDLINIFEEIQGDKE